MPRSASGVYTLPAGNPVVPGTTIDSAWANTTMDDLGTEITNSLSRTGAGGMLVPFRIADGNVTNPGLSFLNETNTGLYRAGAGSSWMSVLGVNVAQFSTVGFNVAVGKSLTAQGPTYLISTLAVTGATTMASTLVVTGAITATGGVIGNVTGNVTSGGTSNFYDVVITGSLDMTVGSAATITGLSTPVNASDAANKGYVDTQDALRLALTGGTMSGAIAMGTSKITGLGTPTADQDAATKIYVDSVAQGLDVKASCRAATIANITLSGAQTIDGVVIIAGERVLVKDQTTAANNGIYLCASGAWTRTTDADTWIELTGAFTFIEDGTVNDNTGWVCTIAPGGTLGSTAVTFEQFSGAGQVIAGAGLTKTGNTLNVGTASSSRIVVNPDDIDLATTGVAASTYQSVTVDTYGRITNGTNPTTLAGYNISDAYTQTQVNTALALKLNLTGGTMSGAIAMGASKITGLADPTVAQDAATKNYIDTIFGSTTSAAASATAAAASASAASTSATNAATSATASAASATSSALSYTTFNNQYLGSYATNPTVNNTGGPLVAGNLYWNSTSSEMRVYSGSAWVAAYLPAAGYLALTGGTMTGAITFAGAQTWPTFNQNTTGTAAGLSATLATTSGGTGQTSYTNGQLLIGNTTGNTLTKATLTAGSGISITNSTGSITIANTASVAAATPTALGTVYGKQTTSGGSPYLTAYGYNAGVTNTTGQSNTFVGRNAGTTSNGNYNSFIGDGAGYSNTSGASNTAVGTIALFTNTTASNNTAVGFQAGYSNLTGTANVYVGYNAGRANSTGNYNIGIGQEALDANTGDSNIGIGYYAVGSNTTGVSNTGVGREALSSNTTGSDNTALGHQALTNTSTGSYNTGIGRQALQTTGTGFNNTAVGYQALKANTSAAYNTATGHQALLNNTTGDSNSAFGTGALLTNSTGTQNCGFGYSALYSTNTGSVNSAFGNGALALNTTGPGNTAIGNSAMYYNTTGGYNTAIGRFSGYSITSGTLNTLLGNESGSNGSPLTTGAYNVLIGNDTRVAASSNDFCIVIGSNTTTGKGTNTGFISPNGNGVYQGNNSATWSVASDERLKKNIVDNNIGLTAINSIRVRNFEYRIADEVTELPKDQAIQKTGVQLGVIAQELQAVLPECVKTESTGVMTVDSDNLTWYMINAIKELKAENDSLKARLDAANL